MSEEDSNNINNINNINIDENITKEENIKFQNDIQKKKDNLLSEFNECFKNTNINKNNDKFFSYICMDDNQLNPNDISHTHYIK